MGKTTIEWTSTRRPDETYTPGYTHNLWWGCVKVGQGCKNCYAETWSKRSGKDYWGTRAPRRFFKDAHYRQPLAWNRAAARAGERHRVFCGSMMDLFERLHPAEPTRSLMRKWRMNLFNEIIPQTLNLDWLLLTKRLENVLEMVPPAWHQCWPRNAWLGFSASTQEEYEDSMLELAAVVGSLQVQSMPPVLFASLEPLLGPVDILAVCPNCDGSGGMDSGGVDPQGHGIDIACPEHTTFLDWVVTGGESGKDARPMHPDWVRRVRDDCVAAGVPFFFKQWGEWWPVFPPPYFYGADAYFLESNEQVMAAHGNEYMHRVLVRKVGKKRAGAVLDGREWRQVPEVENG